MKIASTADYEVSILARLLGNDQNELSSTIARYLLTLGFSQRDKERMHDLSVRNQDGALSEDEKEELAAYARAGTVLSTLKSKARQALKIKVARRSTS